jgi:hypothetical protein
MPIYVGRERRMGKRVIIGGPGEMWMRTGTVIGWRRETRR